MMIIPAAYELHVNEDGTYSLVIQGAIKYDGLTFEESIEMIRLADKKPESTHVDNPG
jgi:hypothetical protein